MQTQNMDKGRQPTLHNTAILGATLHKVDIGKEWLRSGKNAQIFRQQAN